MAFGNKRPAASAKAAGKPKGKAKAAASGRPAGGKAKAKAPAKAAPPAKRQKLDAAARSLQAVVAGMEQATCVPENVKRMVLSMLDIALLSYKEERHEFQDTVVKMAGEVLSGSEAELVKVLDEAKAAEAQAEDTIKSAAEACQKAEEVAKEKQEMTDACEKQLAEHTDISDEKSKAAEEAKASEQSLASEIATATSRKESLIKASEEYVKPLAAGVEEEHVQGLMTPLMASLEGLGLDQSVKVALPDALGKGPDARGQFDKMVVQTVQEELEKRAAALTDEIASLEGQKETRASALVAALGASEVAGTQQKASEEALAQAQSEVDAATEENKKRKAEMRGGVQKLLKAASKDAAAAEKKLNAFRDGPQADFVSLRDRVQEPPQKPEETPAPMEGAEGKTDAEEGEAAAAAAPMQSEVA